MDNEYICSGCVGHEYLSKYIKINGVLGKCKYCEKIRKVIIFDTICEMVEEGIQCFYDDPANGLAYDEGAYVEGSSSIYDTTELIYDALEFEPSIAVDDIIKKLPDQLWCSDEFYGYTDAEEKIYTWNYFSNQVKYMTRYLFVLDKYVIDEPIRYREPYLILKVLENDIHDLNLINVLKQGSYLYRARKSDGTKVYNTINELGPPKPQECIYSNRMSPAGIPMFYGSKDTKTCVCELGNGKGMYSIGKWKTNIDLNILDLTKYFEFSIQHKKYYYPNFPSIFDKSRRDKIHSYQFVLKFASNISEAVVKNGKENIDYVPTQVVAEYLKKIANINNKPIDGICYYSSITGGINYALFLDQNDCIGSIGDPPKIELEKCHKKHVV